MSLISKSLGTDPEKDSCFFYLTKQMDSTFLKIGNLFPQRKINEFMRCVTRTSFQAHSRLVLFRISGTFIWGYVTGGIHFIILFYSIEREAITRSTSPCCRIISSLNPTPSKQSSAQEGTFPNQNKYNYFHYRSS